MKAVILSKSGNGVEVSDISKPSPGPQQILIKVKSCGLNRSDLLETQGQSFGHTGGDTKVIGGEFAGIIEELGSKVSGLSIGQAVMCRGGSGWAEYALAHFGRAVPFDTNKLSWEQACTIHGNLQTMHDAIVTNGQFSKGQTVFIQGASSGVGIIGLQIAKSLGASLILGSSTNNERRSKLKDYGATHTIDTSKEDWLEKVLEITEGKGVDVLIDMLSGDYVNQNMEATKINGYLINIGRLAGMSSNFDHDLHAKRRLHYIGTTGRTRSIDENIEVLRKTVEDLSKFVDSGEIKHVIHKVFKLEQANKALNIMNENKHFGKLVLLTGN
jgi:NADPH2:quinone reductase